MFTLSLSHFHTFRAETSEGANDGLLLWRLLEVLQSLQILRCRGLNIIPIKTLKGIKRSLNEVIGSIDLLILTENLVSIFSYFSGTSSGRGIWSPDTTYEHKEPVKRRCLFYVDQEGGLKKENNRRRFKVCLKFKIAGWMEHSQYSHEKHMWRDTWKWWNVHAHT